MSTPAPHLPTTKYSMDAAKRSPQRESPASQPSVFRGGRVALVDNAGNHEVAHNRSESLPSARYRRQNARRFFPPRNTPFALPR